MLVDRNVLKYNMARSKSSKKWLKEHFSDAYVKKAQQLGYRSRAAFKLLEIQKRDRLIKPNMTIVDLGASPGGWSQVVVELLKNRGKVFALDLLPMKPIAGVEFIQGDFTDAETLKKFLDKLKDQKIDLIMSDMAPNISGVKIVDQARVMYLAESAFKFAQKVLRPGGNFLVKVFQGADFEEYMKLLRKHFSKVASRKPKSSRPRSRELYLLARIFLS